MSEYHKEYARRSVMGAAAGYASTVTGAFAHRQADIDKERREAGTGPAFSRDELDNLSFWKSAGLILLGMVLLAAGVSITETASLGSWRGGGILVSVCGLPFLFVGVFKAATACFITLFRTLGLLFNKRMLMALACLALVLVALAWLKNILLLFA